MRGCRTGTAGPTASSTASPAAGSPAGNRSSATISTTYLARCRKATDLPLAVGFGIQDKDDVMALVGKADMAVIGSRTIRLVDEQGPEAVGPFIASLR